MEDIARSLYDLVVSDEEIAAGALLLHSDLYPDEHGFAWSADHPSGWCVIGHAATLDEALAQTERAIIDALPEDFGVVEAGVRILRPVFDG